MNHTLTIATWNLNRPAATPNARTQAMHAQIAAVKADIWVLTETHADFALPGYQSLLPAISTPPATSVTIRLSRPATRSGRQ
jgi:hypothetical protein